MRRLDRILERYDLKTIEAALARRRVREKERAALGARRRELAEQLSKLTALIGGTQARVTPKVRKPNARRLNKITLADAIEQVLRARKKPAHYKDLTDTIVKRKIYVTKSKNLLSTVVVTLKRDDRFKKVKPGLYALR